ADNRRGWDPAPSRALAGRMDEPFTGAAPVTQAPGRAIGTTLEVQFLGCRDAFALRIALEAAAEGVSVPRSGKVAVCGARSGSARSPVAAFEAPASGNDQYHGADGGASARRSSRSRQARSLAV